MAKSMKLALATLILLAGVAWQPASGDSSAGTCKVDGTCENPPQAAEAPNTVQELEFTADFGVEKTGLKVAALPPRKTVVKKVTGWASRSGIMEGDEIVSMNGKPLSSLDEKRFKAELAVRPLRVKVLRSASTQTIGKQAWWRNVSPHEAKRFGTEDVVIVNTFSFNETVTKTYRNIMIMYYDPRSVSFRDTKEGLMEAAKLLMARRRKLGGDNIGEADDWGVIGACDVTVNNYLAHLEAPEMQQGWQETKASQQRSFTFGRARWWPVILKMYSNGQRLLEYKGVINAENVAPYMRRHTLPEITDLRNKEDLTTFLGRTDPLVLGCGLRNGTVEWAAFNESARFFRGSRLFGRVADDRTELCKGLGVPPGFSGTGESGPVVLMVMSGGYEANVPFGVQNISKPAVLKESEAMVKTIFEMQTEKLPEMTADNSHMYLRNPLRPLLIFMYYGTNLNHRNDGLQLLARLPHHVYDKVSVVWSDCKFYGKQFGVADSCPAMLAVNVDTLDTVAAPLANFSAKPEPGLPKWPWMNASLEAPLRLELWLKAITVDWIPDLWTNPITSENEADSNGTDPNPSSNETVDHNQTEENEEQRPAAAEKDTSVQFRDWLRSFETAKFPRTASRVGQQEFVEKFSDLFAHMKSLRSYYDLRYPHLAFDWKFMDQIQAMHPHMPGAHWPSEIDMPKVLNNPAKLKALKNRIEAYVKFHDGRDTILPNGTTVKRLPIDEEEFANMLERCMNMLARKFRHLMSFLEEHAQAGTLGIPKPEPVDVDRRRASELSVNEFIENYAKPGLPVVITEINVSTVNNWNDLYFFKEKCGSSMVKLQRRQENLTTWGGLRNAGELNMSDFIETYKRNDTRKDWYVFDWSLPRFCPDVFGSPPWDDFKMPKYFAGDYFQRSPFQGYQHTWPSLFIGAQGTGASMHVDSGGTNFIFHLLSGEKEWRFYRRADALNLYSVPLSPSFFFDPFKPDYKVYPLAEYATMYKTLQKANEVMFVPAMSPHGVHNPTDIHGISMNYVDVSNLGLYLREALLKGEYKGFEDMTDQDFPHGLRSDQEDLSFGEWKSQPWKTLSYDIW